MADETERTRMFTWQDPAILAREGATMSGRAMLEGMRDGTLPKPPFVATVGMNLVEVGEGHVVFTLEPQEYLYNPLGVVHGGAIATLLDSAMACAIITLLPQGMSNTTLELKINYIRAITRDTGLVRGEGTVIHQGRQTAVAEGRVVDAQGKLLAHATTTCLLFRTP
jgi:uncharacterized protein (TIGR00369 family)